MKVNGKMTLPIALSFLMLILPALVSAGALVPVKVEVPDKYRKGAFAQDRSLDALPGIRVCVFAAGLPGARFMAASGDGTIFLSVPSDGTVIALPDRDGDGVADDAVVFARNLKKPHGLAFKDGKLIVAETGSLIALEDTKGNLKADVKMIISQDIPAGGGHWTRSVAIGPDGAIYVSAGSSCNSCVEDDRRRASILRLDGANSELYATGLRNSVGVGFHPATGELWAVDNGRDGLGDDLPPEELNRIVKGADYGWPYCYGKRVPDPELGSPERCSGTAAAAVEMQAHSAPLGIAFSKGMGLPGRLRDALFIAFHGSWDRSVPTGYKLVAIPLSKGRPSGETFDIVSGWLRAGEAWGRPVGVLAGRDGAVYLSDDKAGAIYRITYKAPKKGGGRR